MIYIVLIWFLKFTIAPKHRVKFVALGVTLA